MLIDLHAHSFMSDGSYSPRDLIKLSVCLKIDVLALCDHDTTAGISEFLAYGKDNNLTTIPGIELSATWKKGACHIVGLGMKTYNKILEKTLLEIRDSRDNRNEHIIKKLNQLHINITSEELEKFAGGEVVSRPHIAQIMLRKGLVHSVQEAFDKYLAKGQPAYVDRYRLEPENAVELLHNAGALPILAHPSQLRISIEETETFVKKLKSHGLAGIEIYTPYTPDKYITDYLAIAQRNGLYISGGSDFHGESKPDHILGYYREDKKIPDLDIDFITGISIRK